MEDEPKKEVKEEHIQEETPVERDIYLDDAKLYHVSKKGH